MSYVVAMSNWIAGCWLLLGCWKHRDSRDQCSEGRPPDNADSRICYRTSVFSALPPTPADTHVQAAKPRSFLAAQGGTGSDHHISSCSDYSLIRAVSFVLLLPRKEAIRLLQKNWKGNVPGGSYYCCT